MAERQYTFRLQARGGDQVKAEFRKAASGLSGSAQVIEREAARINSSLGRIGRSTGHFGGAMRNVGLQLNQVAQQGAVTGNYLRALAVQMPDMLLGFGTFGVLVGAAAAALIPFAGGLLDAANAGEKLRKTFDEALQSINQYKAAIAAAAAPIGTLREKYGELAETMRSVLAAQKELARLNAREAVIAAQSALQDVYGSLNGFAPDQIRLVGMLSAARLEAIADEIEDLRRRAEAAIDIDETLNLEAAAEARGDILILANEIEKAADAYGLTREAAAELLATLEELGNAKSIEGMVASAGELTAKIESGEIALEGMSDETRELIEQLLESVRIAAEFAAVDMAAPIRDAQAAADRLLKTSDDSALFFKARFAQEDELMSQSLVPKRLSSEQIERALGVGKTAVRGRRGGGGARQVDQSAQAFERLRRQLDKAYDATRRMEEGQKLLNWALKSGKIDAAEYETLLQKLRESVDQAADGVQSSAERISGAFMSAFGNVRSVLDDARGALASFLDALANMVWQSALTPVANAIGSALGGLPIFGSAKGNIFMGGRPVTAFASGGVVSGPTIFPMRGGGTGLMGEAGPEAIMPLRRIGGRLGVEAVSAGMVEVLVRVDESGNLEPVIERTAGRVTASVVTDYDRNRLPRRIQDVQRDPRRRG